MPRARKLYDDPRWKPVRNAVLERDGWRCTIQGRKCRGTANCVDHIVPPEDGGAPFDLTNLRASCLQCNSGRSRRIELRRQRNRTSTVVEPSRAW